MTLGDKLMLRFIPFSWVDFFYILNLKEVFFKLIVVLNVALPDFRPFFKVPSLNF